MFVARRNWFSGEWFKFGECPGCQRGALIGAVLGWGLVAMIVIGGDGMQLAIAAVLAALGMTVLWGVHRVAMSMKASRARRRGLAQSAVAPAPAVAKKAVAPTSKKKAMAVAKPKVVAAVVAEAAPEIAPVAELSIAASAPPSEADSVAIVEKTLEARFDLTDLEWAVIQPVLPKSPQGAPRPDDRQVLNGILWRLRTGSPWTEIPERYGPHKVCSSRFNQWRRSGVWKRLLAAVSRVYEGDIQLIDSAKAGLRQPAATDGVVKSDPVAWVARQAA